MDAPITHYVVELDGDMPGLRFGYRSREDAEEHVRDSKRIRAKHGLSPVRLRIDEA